MLWVTYVVILAALGCAIALCFKQGKPSAYGLATACILLFSIVFLTNHPIQNNISSELLSVSRQIDQIEQRQEQLVKITTILSKMVFVAKDEAGRIGHTPEHQERLEVYAKELQTFLGPDFINTTKKEVSDILKK